MRCSLLKKAETWIGPLEFISSFCLFVCLFICLAFFSVALRKGGSIFSSMFNPVFSLLLFQMLLSSFLNCCYVFNLGMGIGFQAKGTVVILFTVTCSYSCISYRCMILMITPRQIECIVNTYALEYILACSVYASRQAERQ